MLLRIVVKVRSDMPYPWPFTDTCSPDLPSRDWARLHPSWKAFEVARSSGSRDEARARLLPRFDVPAEVLEQWLCAHYYKPETALTYGWIDYDRAGFVRERWSTEAILGLRVISAYRHFVDERTSADWSLTQTPFAPDAGDEDAWRLHGTWRVPPVVVDPVGLGTPPQGADITSSSQLVEGHTRVSNLRRFLRLGSRSGVTLAPEHAVYVLGAG